MSMRKIEPSAFIDVHPSEGRAAASQLAYSDAPLTGVVIGVVDAVLGLVEVAVDGAGETVIALADAGLTYVGARVSLPRDSSGRVTGVRAPSGPTPDGVEVIAVGETGRMTVETAERSAAAEAAAAAARAEAERAVERMATLDGDLAETRRDVEANHAQVTARLAESSVAITAAQARADAAASEASAARDAAVAATARADQGVSAAAAAAAKALGAQSTADQAAAKASTADGRYTVASKNPTAGDATGKPEGAVWEVRSGSTSLRRYVLQGSSWVQVKVGQDFIGAKAIGAAQIGDAAIGTAQVADAAITNAKIGDLSVSKLTATGGATFPTAVMSTLLADQAFLKSVLAQSLTVAPTENLLRGLSGETNGAGVIPSDSRWSYDAAEKAWKWSTGRSGSSLSIPTPVDLAVGGDYVLEVDLRSSKPGQCVFVQYRRDLAQSAFGSHAGSGSSKSYAVDTWKAPDTDWHTRIVTGVSAVSVVDRIAVWCNHSLGSTTDASLWIRARIRRKVGAVDIRDGSITTPKLAAGAVKAKTIDAEDVAGAVGRFLRVTTDQIDAGAARIAGPLIADNMTGKTFTGSTFVAGSEDGANAVIMGPERLDVVKGGIPHVRLDPAIQNGIAVKSPNSNALLPLASIIFGASGYTWTGTYPPDAQGYSKTTFTASASTTGRAMFLIVSSYEIGIQSPLYRWGDIQVNGKRIYQTPNQFNEAGWRSGQLTMMYLGSGLPTAGTWTIKTNLWMGTSASAGFTKWSHKDISAIIIPM